MRTVIVACANGAGWVVVFKEGDDIKRTEGFALWADASRAILGWL